jgi:hypothetical protein
VNKKIRAKNEVSMKKLTLLLLAAFLFVSSPVLAFDSASLLDRCSEAEKSFQKLEADNTKTVFCIGYLYGVIDTYDSLKNKNKEPLYCLQGNDMELYVQTVVKFLKNNPSFLTYNPPISIIQSFIEMFPCSGQMSTQ